LSYERYIRCGSPPLTSTSISPSNTERRWWTSAPDVLLFYGMEKIICIEGLELREKKKKPRWKLTLTAIAGLLWILLVKQIFCLFFKRSTIIFPGMFLFFFVLNTSACFHEFIPLMGVFVCRKRRMTRQWNWFLFTIAMILEEMFRKSSNLIDLSLHLVCFKL